jgi:hypothetical protein
MKAQGTPLTVKNYLNLNYPEGAPHPLTGEMISELPAELLEKDPAGAAQASNSQPAS